MNHTQAVDCVARMLHQSRCGCNEWDDRTDGDPFEVEARAVVAALFDQYGQTQWGLRWEGNDIPFEGSEAEAREHIILGGQTLLSRRVLPSIETEWEPAT